RKTTSTCAVSWMTTGSRSSDNMLNAERHRQFLELMSESGWDRLLLYGHSWRKDFFRSLVNFNFFGPHAVAALTPAGELSIVLAHPWDQEILAGTLDANVTWQPDFAPVIRGWVSGKTAIA